MEKKIDKSDEGTDKATRIELPESISNIVQTK